jgi:hypothetical protein
MTHVVAHPALRIFTICASAALAVMPVLLLWRTMP